MVAFKLASSLWVFLPAFAALHFLHPFTGPAVAHLQLATPNQYRGRVAALFVLVFNLMGMCLGPPSVAFITDFVLGDPMRVNESIAIMSVACLSVAAVLFTVARSEEHTSELQSLMRT